MTMRDLPSYYIENASTYGALDLIPTALVLVSGEGKVVFCNRAAVRLLSGWDGIRLVGAAGGDRLEVGDAAKQRALDRAIRCCAAVDGEEAERLSSIFKVARPSGNLDFVVRVVPLGIGTPLSLENAEARAIVFISDPAQPGRLDARMLETLYGLTPAEARLAQGLLEGGSLGEIAASTGLKESTVRSQVSSIFEKTHTSRQPQLIKLLMSLREVP